MPTYSYACTQCDNKFDIVQSFTDNALTTCDHCGNKLRKLFNSVGVVFKGSGFYRNDSRDDTAKSNHEKSSPPEKDNQKADNNSSTSANTTSSATGTAGGSGTTTPEKKSPEKKSSAPTTP